MRVSLMLIAVLGLAAAANAGVILSGYDTPLPTVNRPDLDTFILVFTTTLPGEKIYGWDIEITGTALNQLACKTSGPTKTWKPTAHYNALPGTDPEYDGDEEDPPVLPLGSPLIRDSFGSCWKEYADTHFLYSKDFGLSAMYDKDGNPLPLENGPAAPAVAKPYGDPLSYSEGSGTFLIDILGVPAGVDASTGFYVARVVVPAGTGATYRVVGKAGSSDDPDPQSTPVMSPFDVALIPEPATMLLLGLGGFGLVLRRRRS